MNKPSRIGLGGNIGDQIKPRIVQSATLYTGTPLAATLAKPSARMENAHRGTQARRRVVANGQGGYDWSSVWWALAFTFSTFLLVMILRGR